MSSVTPLLYKKSAEEVVADLQAGLAVTGWHKAPATGTPGAGEAMVRLFGRLADLIAARLNQVPENHFRAFLETAGVDLLSPRPARSEITFYPAKDAPQVIRVPAGTQVAAKKSGERPEIVFETERDLNVVRAELASCIVVDPVRISDRSDRAKGGSGDSFAAFLGDEERGRILYLGDDALFVFPDDISRELGTITLEVTLASVGRPDLDGWRVEWLYFDGTAWQELVKQGGGIVRDTTGGFAASGQIEFTRLPALVKFPFDKQSGAWLACRLTGGSGRDHLPVVSMLRARRKIDIPTAPGKPADAAFSAIHAGVAFIPLETAGEFFPLGQRPGRLDCFYLKADEAFAKEGADVEISLDLVGLSDAEQSALLAKPVVEWSSLAAGTGPFGRLWPEARGNDHLGGARGPGAEREEPEDRLWRLPEHPGLLCPGGCRKPGGQPVLPAQFRRGCGRLCAVLQQLRPAGPLSRLQLSLSRQRVDTAPPGRGRGADRHRGAAAAALGILEQRAGRLGPPAGIRRE
ncbi:MAG: hypothetical protein HZC44_05305 [Geobacter sp.]|nr:hypothetical protein [Geobacter sp.]